MVGRPGLLHGGFVVLTGTLVTVFLLGGLASNVAVLLSSLVPTVVFAVQLRTGKAPDRVAWGLLLGGLSLLVVHNATSVVTVATTGDRASGAAHVATLMIGYLLILTGGLLATVPLARTDPGGMIDATIIGLATTSLVWTTLVQPHQMAVGISPGGQLSQLVLLLLVSAMVGTVLRAIATAADARPALVYLTVAILGAFAGTLSDGLTENPATGERAWWIGACWVIANVATAAGISHPSAPDIAVQPSTGRLSTRRLAFLGAALALNPVITAVDYAMGREPDAALLSLGSLLVLPLVIARIVILARMHASAEERLRELATVDELTGLPNRRALSERLEALIARTSLGYSPGAAVLFLDLDDFKAVNDGHGHRLGDRLLVEVARRLRRTVRANDLVARFGGDEFVLVLEGSPDGSRAAGLAAIERALEAPVHLDALVVTVRASIGSAVIRPGQPTTAEQVVSAADASMYRVKRARRSGGLVTQRTAANAPDAAPDRSPSSV
ncbi:GGDEF domain-containing protein [Actinotalea sp. M2MS4P-6]|uniref:GGDEF domain-containing protein n=1 Tax=Actinotalea sp. M2MS4P-6 TaxID=2983762 RepID=UPI0021E45B92|nr:GGDEF domain-containing protein [Actinotalea sp. M2MS4P-6]MCV2395482.1 GGDEF domain-containing protein [Actinotalea sp. M2MS4P-6]